MKKVTLLPLLACALAVLFACASNTADGEISRERAIELARQHITFEPRTTEAEPGTENGRPVWRVTFRGKPMEPNREMAELQIVTIDRRTGEMVTVSMS